MEVGVGLKVLEVGAVRRGEDGAGADTFTAGCGGVLRGAGLEGFGESGGLCGGALDFSPEDDAGLEASGGEFGVEPAVEVGEGVEDGGEEGESALLVGVDSESGVEDVFGGELFEEVAGLGVDAEVGVGGFDVEGIGEDALGVGLVGGGADVFGVEEAEGGRPGGGREEAEEGFAVAPGAAGVFAE